MSLISSTALPMPEAKSRKTLSFTMPANLLRLESVAILIAATAIYRSVGGDWLPYAVVFFTPDISFIGYLINARVGAWAYNFIHTLAVSLALVGLGLAVGNPIVLQLGLILTAHIGFDRLFGYGLKYASAFKDSHLDRV